MAVDDPAVTYQAFRDLIVGHLIQKGWKRLLGKRIRYEQSLFEHSLNTLDVVLTYLPVFRQTWHPPLTLDEEVALIVTAVAHDAGKATDEFQRYIRGGVGLGWTLVARAYPGAGQRALPALGALLGPGCDH